MTGKAPYPGGDRGSKARRHLDSKPISKNEIQENAKNSSAGFCDVIYGMLLKEPDDRYQSMDEVIDSLGNWLPQNPQQTIMNWMSSSPETNPHDEWVLSEGDLLEGSNERVAVEQPSRGLEHYQSNMQAEVLKLVIRTLVVGVGVSVFAAAMEFSFGEGVSYRSVVLGLVGAVVVGGIQVIRRVLRSSS